jgi:hypothetical protein
MVGRTIVSGKITERMYISNLPAWDQQADSPVLYWRVNLPNKRGSSEASLSVELRQLYRQPVFSILFPL